VQPRRQIPCSNTCAIGSPRSLIVFDLAALEAELKQLEDQMSLPGFWEDRHRAKLVAQQVEQKRRILQRYKALETQLDDLEVLEELGKSEGDPSVEREVQLGAQEFEKRLAALELEAFLNEPYDPNDCYLSIQAGAGGTDAQDWAEMLLRMYLRYIERRGWRASIIEVSPGEVAGIKSATIEVQGPYAYGYLKAERGVHRLVRISPFDANARRHTSFAAVTVIPKVEETDVEIRPEDLKIDTFRAGGAGGQYVNKTESAVRITHLPTGIVVTCQRERSQQQNKEIALEVLAARLYELKLREKEQEIAKVRGELRAIEWGSQIRSYVLQPYQLVKDHRTEIEVGNVQAVLDGELDTFIEGYLRRKR
jgi:peptide chain release factor 2